jgi:hypothetical protein
MYLCVEAGGGGCSFLHLFEDFTIGFWYCFEGVVFFIISFSFCYCICLYLADLRLSLVSSTLYSIK